MFWKIRHGFKHVVTMFGLFLHLWVKPWSQTFQAMTGEIPGQMFLWLWRNPAAPWAHQHQCDQRASVAPKRWGHSCPLRSLCHDWGHQWSPALDSLQRWWGSAQAHLLCWGQDKATTHLRQPYLWLCWNPAAPWAHQHQCDQRATVALKRWGAPCPLRSHCHDWGHQWWWGSAQAHLPCWGKDKATVHLR